MKDRISVLVVDDHRLFCSALSSALYSEDSCFEVMGPAYSRPEALELSAKHQPDVAVVDLHLPTLEDGLSTLKSLSRVMPCLAISGDREKCVDALGAGARGFVAKAERLEDFVGAVRAVAGGAIWIGPTAVGIVSAYLTGATLSNVRAGNSPQFTPRELQVLELMAQLKSPNRIAGELRINQQTARGYVRRIQAKLGASNSEDAVSRAQKLEILASVTTH